MKRSPVRYGRLTQTEDFPLRESDVLWFSLVCPSSAWGGKLSVKFPTRFLAVRFPPLQNYTTLVSFGRESLSDFPYLGLFGWDSPTNETFTESLANL